MKKELRAILEDISKGGTDLWTETETAASQLLEGNYEGFEEDIDYLDSYVEDGQLKTGFDLERILCGGKWYCC